MPTNPIKTRLKSPFIKLFIRSSLIRLHINPIRAPKPIFAKYMSIPKQEIAQQGSVDKLKCVQLAHIGKLHAISSHHLFYFCSLSS